MALLLEFKLEWKNGGGMAKDWVDKYVKAYADQDKSKEADLHFSKIAANRAPDVLEAVRARVKDDITTFGSRTRSGIQFIPIGPGFKVRKPVYPAVTLDVSLDGTTIKCTYAFKEADTSTERTVDALFRVFANPDDSVQVKKNGDVYADESEISEAVLAPVFDFVSGKR